MTKHSREQLKLIRFEGEMLPQWAQLLDLAARLCPVPDETRQWFEKFADAPGVDDARTVLKQCGILKAAVAKHEHEIVTELQHQAEDTQPSQILAGWKYALDTMIQVASSKKTCSWRAEELDDEPGDGFGGGDITLRRV